MGVNQRPGQNSTNSLKFLWLYWLAGAAQGLLAAGLLLGERQQGGAGGLLGLSSVRLLVAVLILLPSILFLVLAYLQRVAQPKYQAWLNRLIVRLEDERFFLLLLVVSGIVFSANAYLITAATEIHEPFTRNLLENMLPLFIWLSGLATQSILFLISLRIKDLRNTPKPKVFLFSIAIFVFTFMAWAWIAQISLPSESQIRGWNSLGVPVMETQLFLAWLISLAFLVILVVFEHQVQTRSILARLRPSTVDIIVCVLIWAAAVLTWQSISVPTSWFITEDRPPNFAPYPNSDAFYYDISAQTALVGEGFVFFDTPFIRRPLHAAYLTLLHLFGGQDFGQVISIQLLVLAFLPVLVYLVGRSLHNRISGLLAALLILMRETSSIAISGNITASHVKLLMVDVPVALMVTLFVLMVLRWLQNLHTGKLHALIAGGALGLCVLIRNETIIFILPLAFLLLLITPKEKRSRLWLQQVLLFTWGMCLVVAPWIWRNYNLTGKIFIDSPIMRFDLIAQRYQDVHQDPLPSPGPEPAPTARYEQPAPGTSAQATPAASAEPSGESADEHYVKAVARQTLEFISSNPSGVARFIISHYTNSQLQTLLIFPAALRPLDSLVGLSGHRSLEVFWDECCSMQNYTRRLPFWRKWDGAIPMQSLIPIILNILVLSWGFQVAWREKKLIGLAPLSLVFTYILMNALFRNSGGRYILPVDWIMIIYLSIGLADLSTRVMQKIFGFNLPAILRNEDPDHLPAYTTPAMLRSPAFYSLSALLVLFGSLIPLTEKAFSPRFTASMQETLAADLFESILLQANEKAALEGFLAQGGTFVSGRALYPRFFREFLGEPGSNNPFGPQAYPRIGFYLAGPQHFPVILPMLTKPGYLPHASDVLVFRCSTEEVFAIAVFDEQLSAQAIYLRSPSPLSLGCPFPPQDISIQVK